MGDNIFIHRVETLCYAIAPFQGLVIKSSVGAHGFKGLIIFIFLKISLRLKNGFNVIVIVIVSYFLLLLSGKI